MATHDIEMEKAVTRLNKYFGPYYDQIKARTGIDIPQLTQTASAKTLLRLGRGQEVIIDGSVNIEPGRVVDGVWSFRLISVKPVPGKDGWNFFMYPIPFTQDEAGKHLMRKTLKEGEDLVLGNVVHKAGSDEVESWRLCGMGIVQETAAGPVLFTPSKWNDSIGISRRLSYVESRLSALLGKELFLRPFTEEGKLSKGISKGFVLGGNDEAETKNTASILLQGGQVTLTNGAGEKACVRYDCGENNLVETIPFKLAQRIDRRESVSKTASMAEQRSLHTQARQSEPTIKTRK